MSYLMVLTAGGYRTSPDSFACESAFAEHLRTLKASLGARFDEVVVAMGEMTDADYAAQKDAMTVVHEHEGIRFAPVFPWHSSRVKFAIDMPAMIKKLAVVVNEADLVHSHLSYDLYRPVELVANALAVAMGKKLVAITDMDNRKDAEM